MREHAWIRLIVSGDKLAGERFVREHYARIERLLRHLTGSPDLARDLTQQTFLKAWQALPAFRGEASLATWLHRIAYHEYTHWLRDRREHAPLEAALSLPAPPPLVTDWGLTILPDALAQLTEELRAVFLLYYLQELSVPEIARILDIPRGTVKSRLHTGRQRLREILKQDLEDTRSPATRARPEIPAQYRIDPGATRALLHAEGPAQEAAHQELRGGNRA